MGGAGDVPEGAGGTPSPSLDLSHVLSILATQPRYVCIFLFFPLLFLVCIPDFFGLMDMCWQEFIKYVKGHVYIAEASVFFWALGQNRFKIPSLYQS